MPFNYSKLRGKIKEIFGNENRFAKAIGISGRSLSLKLNSEREWKQSQMIKACEVLGIDIESIPIYFFIQNVQCVEQSE